MPLRYHHGGSSFRIPAAPGKKSEASKKIGQSRRLARINTGISAARNPHIKYLRTDQVVSFSCIHLLILLLAYAQNLYFIQASLLTQYHINPSKPKRIPQLYAVGSEKMIFHLPYII